MTGLTSTATPHSFQRTFTSPFRQSAHTTSTEVPGRFDIAINGRGYMLDLKTGAFGMQSIPISRAQSDTNASPSEASLSREDLWRRAFESWHHGAGQSYRDRTTSDDFRFRSSLGLDAWTRDALTLLPSTAKTLTLLGSSPLLATTASHVYANAMTTVSFSTDATAWTTATGLGGGTILGLTSDGSKLYVADGLNIYQSNPGGAFTSWSSLNASLLAFVNGRLMAAGATATKNAIYNITDPGGAAPAALYSHPDVDWTWTAFASGQQAIYAAGYAGDKSAIYSIPILADGSGLDQPLVALALPDGERVLSLHGYLDFLAIGTTKGLRLAALGDTLTAGSPIDVPPVHCIEGQDRFLWFGWSDYDDFHSGLGRADLSVFVSPLTSAYASDLMAFGQLGTVIAVATFGDKRVFTVAGSGVWVEQDTLVDTGTLDTGWVTFGLPDKKVLETVDVRTEPLEGSVTVAVAGTSGQFNVCSPVHDQATTTGQAMSANETAADRFELRVTLALETSTAGPNLSRVTMHANPSPPRGEIWILPVLLAQEVRLFTGEKRRYSATDETDFVRLLANSGVLCSLQIGRSTHSVFVVDYEWKAHALYPDNTDWSGTLFVSCKAPSRRED